MLSEPLNVEGGKVIIERLLHLFKLRSKVELSGIIGISTGSIATWQTRSTVPYELLIRIHLATGVSMEYLLFDRVVGDINVMQYCPEPSVKPSYATINQNLKHFRYSLCEPAHYDAGEQIIKRLIKLLNIKTKAEFSKATSVSIGTLATWHTRKITPYELLCRIHLATGVSMHYLCFGKEWEDVEAIRQKVADSKPANTHDKPNTRFDGSLVFLNSYRITDGTKVEIEPLVFSTGFLSYLGVVEGVIEVVDSDTCAYFVNTKITNITKGQYLFSINDLYQIDELKLLPDGKVYYIDGDDKYPINPDTTRVIGKVVSILKKV